MFLELLLNKIISLLPWIFTACYKCFFRFGISFKKSDLKHIFACFVVKNSFGASRRVYFILFYYYLGNHVKKNTGLLLNFLFHYPLVEFQI